MCVCVCVCAGFRAILRECDRWYYGVRSFRPPHRRLGHLQEVQRLVSRGRESDSSVIVCLDGRESDSSVIVCLDARGHESDSRAGRLIDFID